MPVGAGEARLGSCQASVGFRAVVSIRPPSGKRVTNLVSSVDSVAEAGSIKRGGKGPDLQMREGVTRLNVGLKHA